MAIKKQVTYKVTCEGPCKQTTTVDKIPPLWNRLKIVEAVQVIGHPAQYLVSTLCEKCTTDAIRILKANGFTLMRVNAPEEEK